MSNLYEVSSFTAFVMKKASSFSIILGVLPVEHKLML